LARRIEEVVGVDVSTSMLAESERNCERDGIVNVTLLKSDDGLTKLSGRFDFIHSFIVFQHIPVHRGELLLQKMLASLADGGVGALHFTYASTMPAWKRALRRARAVVPYLHNFANVVQGLPFGTPNMQMNEYDTKRLFLLLQQNGCHRIHVRFSNHGGFLGLMLFFKKETLPPL
jgi:trans-aconitate methyltransferase